MSRAAKFGPGFTWSSNFGERDDPRNPAKREFHPGIDAVAPAGTPIPAATPGTSFVGSDGEGRVKLNATFREANGDFKTVPESIRPQEAAYEPG
jgi:hypothetical protein